MTFLGELWHVVKKDLRQSRWLLGAFVVLAIAATMGAVSAENLAGGRLQLAAMLMIAMGPMVAASIVQADSPTRADAFWASRPFRRSAMLGAKLVLVATLLLVLPLIGQWLGLIAFQVPRGEQWPILRTSAAIYGFVLLLAMFLAALTPELRSFVLAVVTFLAATLAVGISTSGDVGSAWDKSGMREVSGAIGLIGVVSLLVLLYLRRGLRWARTLGAAALALLLAGTVSSSGGEPRAVVTIDTTRFDPGPLGITVEMRDTARIRLEGRFHLRIALTGASGNQRYRLDKARAQFFLRNGKTTEMPLWVFGPIVLRSGELELPGIPSVHDDLERFSGSSVEQEQAVLGDVRPELLGGVDSMRVTGNLIPVQPRVFATLPLREGASVLRNGQSIRIEALNFDGSDDIVRLVTKSVGKQANSQDWASDAVGTRVYLVNEARGEGIALPRGSASSNQGLLVLPGAGVSQRSSGYRMPIASDSALPPLNGDWVRGAKLLLIDWEDGPSVPVRASSIPLPPKTFDASPPVVTGGSPVLLRIPR